MTNYISKAVTINPLTAAEVKALTAAEVKALNELDSGALIEAGGSNYFKINPSSNVEKYLADHGETIEEEAGYYGETVEEAIKRIESTPGEFINFIGEEWLSTDIVDNETWSFIFVRERFDSDVKPLIDYSQLEETKDNFKRLMDSRKKN